jgi:hypothetical protein
MKTLIPTFAFVLLFSAVCLAQGKVLFVNDTASLVVLGRSIDVSQADAPLAHQPVGNLTPLPSGVVLSAGLYGGTNPASLFLYGTTLLNDTNAPAGSIGPLHIILTAQPNGAPQIDGIPTGTPIGPSTPWFQVKVWDSRFPTYEQAEGYSGAGWPFQMNPGNRLASPRTAPAGPDTTWTDAPIVVGASPYGIWPPFLKAEASGNQIILSWQNSDPPAPFRLQSTTNFADPTSWNSVSETPAFMNGTYVVTNQLSGANHFYRLVYY